MADWLRYGWPRWYLLRLSNWLPSKYEERMLDFLYPSDMEATFDAEK